MVIFRDAVLNPGIFTYITITITLTAGTAFLMWLGEVITDKGIGNGISPLFSGYCFSLARVLGTFELARVGETSIFTVIATVVVMLALIVGIIAIEEGQRRIPCGTPKGLSAAECMEDSQQACQ